MNKFLSLSVQPGGAVRKGIKSIKGKGREAHKNNVYSWIHELFCLTGEQCVCVYMCECVCVRARTHSGWKAGRQTRKASLRRWYLFKALEEARGWARWSSGRSASVAGRGDVNCKDSEAGAGLASFEQRGDICGWSIKDKEEEAEKVKAQWHFQGLVGYSKVFYPED